MALHPKPELSQAVISLEVNYCLSNTTVRLSHRTTDLQYRPPKYIGRTAACFSLNLCTGQLYIDTGKEAS